MKKHLLYLLAVISAAVSCQLADIEEVNTTEKDYPVFTASITDGTKVSLDGTDLSWEAGDQIAITKDGGTAIYKALTSGETTTFVYVSGAFGKGTGSYVAYYPSTLASTFEATYTTTAAKIKDLPMRAEAATETDVLNFKALGGILKIKVSKDASETQAIKVNQIQVRAIEPIAGSFTCTADETTLSAEVASTGLKTVKVNLEKPLEITSEPTVFYVQIPANTYSEGLTVVICTDKGVKKMVSTQELTLQRAHITPMSVSVSTADFGTPVAKATNDNGKNWTPCATLHDAISTILPGGKKTSNYIEILDDFTMTEPVYVDEDKIFTIKGNGHTIDASKLDRNDLAKYGMTSDKQVGAICINSLCDITMSNLTIDGGSTIEPLDYRAITELKGNSAGKLYLEGTSAITGFHSTLAGPAVRLCSYLYMKDNSRIFDCETTTNSGGAIALSWGNTYCAVYMQGNSSISCCSAAGSGGAIYNGSGYLSTNVYLQGNSSITNCHARNGSGGAINAYNVSIKDDAYISDCSAAAASGKTCYGGAIRVNGKLTMAGNAHITNCYNGGEGSLNGTVYITTGGSAASSMTDYSYIEDCTSSYGGGIYNYKKTLTMSGNAAINNCTSTAGSGGGIYASGATINMNEYSTIKNCTSSAYGGGIYAASTTVLNIGLNDGDNPSIAGNTSPKAGAAIYLGTGTVTIDRGNISSNASSTMVYDYTGTIKIHGGFYKQEGSGSMFLKYSSKYTFTTDCSVSNCYLSHSTGYVASGYTQVTLSDADNDIYFPYGYKYKIAAK